MRLALSLFLGVISATATSGLTIPSVSKADARAYEEENTKKNGFTFARPEEVTIDTSTDDATGGIWDSDARSWTMNVTSSGAPSLNFGFTNYKLPNNAILTIRCNSEDPSVDCEGVPPIEVIGSKQNSKSKEYWTPLLDCDAVIIELKYETDNTMTTAPIDFTLSYINIGFSPFGNIGLRSSGGEKVGRWGCNVDVACKQGDGWQSEIRSAATVTIRGVGACSGVLINNMKQDRKPYFLTAEHCKVNEKNTPSLVIYWNYENSRCKKGDDWRKQRERQSGAEHLQTATFPNSTQYGDAHMVRLNEEPKSSWKVAYAGWDNSPDANTGPYACIHHPRGKEKKIAIGNDTMIVTRFFENAPNDTHVKVFWDAGTTEPGSSGSPLFNGAHRMIGLLSGGPANCTNTGTDNGYDYFGRFSKAYEAYAKWLDPNDVLNGKFGGIDTYDPYWFVETKQYACLRDDFEKLVGTAYYRWQKKGNTHRMVLSVKMTDLKSKNLQVSVDKSKKCRSVMFTDGFIPRNPFNYDGAKYEYEKNKNFELILTGNGSAPKRKDGKTIIVSDANNKVVVCGIITDKKKNCRKRTI